MENENYVNPSEDSNPDTNKSLVPITPKQNQSGDLDKVEEYFKRIRSTPQDASQNQVQQSGNWVRGDQVGRDKNINHNYNFGTSQKNITALSILLEKFKVS